MPCQPLEPSHHTPVEQCNLTPDRSTDSDAPTGTRTVRSALRGTERRDSTSQRRDSKVSFSEPLVRGNAVAAGDLVSVDLENSDGDEAWKT